MSNKPNSSQTINGEPLAVPYLSINRMAYSLNSFNQQFRRVSQMSPNHEHLYDYGMNPLNRSSSVKIERTKASINRIQKCISKLICNCFHRSARWASTITPFTFCRQYVPAFEWISEYPRTDFMSDLLTGLTIAVFHVPECLGYSFLADVSPIYCLYSSFFPTLIYSFIGTSQYCSVGTFAALSIMTGTVIKETNWIIHRESMLQHSLTMETNSTTPFDNIDDYEIVSSYETMEPVVMFRNEDIAFVCSFIVGIYLLIFGLFRMGFLSVYMSEPFLNGFTCSVAFHVLASQLQHMLGLPHFQIGHSEFVLWHYMTNIVFHLNRINPVSLFVSILTAFMILFSKFYLDPWLRNRMKLKISFPIEFVVVLFGVIGSNMFNLSNRYQVKVIGAIQRGLPQPKAPQVVGLFKYVWQPCISIAVISYAITYSIGRTFLNQAYESKGLQTTINNNNNNNNNNKKPMDHRSWEINPSQELIALGCCNLISSFFSCIPSGASLSRSSIQFGSGGRTQLVSIINCIGILFILYMSSILESLPNAILATTISIALRNLLGNVAQFHRYWTISKVDASVWMVTFLSVIIIGINWGLYIGLLYSLLTLIYKSQLPPSYLLGAISLVDEKNTLDYFVPLNQYINARELPGIKIFQFCGPLHFANAEYFVKQLEAKLKISIKELIKMKTIITILDNSLVKLSSSTSVSVISSNNIKAKEKCSNENMLETIENEDEDNSDGEQGQLSKQFSCSTTIKPFCSRLSLSKGNLSQYSTMELQYRRHLLRSLPDYLVIDCSMFSYIDIDGVKMIRRLIKDFQFLNVKVFLGGCPSHVGQLLEQSDLSRNDRLGQIIYISVLDAIEHARQEQQDQANRFMSVTSIEDQQIQSEPTMIIDNNVIENGNVPFIEYPLMADTSFTGLHLSTNEPISSLFSSSMASTFQSIDDDSVIQQMTHPNVIELSNEDDCQSVWIEEDGIDDY